MDAMLGSGRRRRVKPRSNLIQKTKLRNFEAAMTASRENKTITKEDTPQQDRTGQTNPNSQVQKTQQNARRARFGSRPRRAKNAAKRSESTLWVTTPPRKKRSKTPGEHALGHDPAAQKNAAKRTESTLWVTTPPRKNAAKRSESTLWVTGRKLGTSKGTPPTLGALHNITIQRKIMCPSA